MDISVCGLCNRMCPFCPRSNRELFPNISEYMEFSLFIKIVKELKILNYKNGLAFSGFSEPLLHKDLTVMIKTARQYCPNITITIVTNGDLLTIERLNEFFRNGLNRIKISLYDGPEQLNHFIKMRERANLTESELIIRKRYLSEGMTEYGSIPGFIPTNRGGTLQNKEAYPELNLSDLESPLSKGCYYPFYFVMVDYNGDVLLCTHDWGKKMIMGNLNNSSLYELWISEKMMEVRHSLRKGNRNFKPCSECDVDGTLKGEKAYHEWIKLL